MNASPPRSPYRSPPRSPASPRRALRDIADEKYDPDQPAIRQVTPERHWLSDNPHVVAQDHRLQQLFRNGSWTSDDEAYVQHIIGQFNVHDMPSFFRVQAHQWILYNMHVLQQNDFLARMFDKMHRGEGFSERDADTLNRTVWRLMSDDDRRVASSGRRDAERRYGRMERPEHRQRRARPTVAGYPVEIAEAYLNYHRADVDQFALSYFEQQRHPRYNALY